MSSLAKNNGANTSLIPAPGDSQSYKGADARPDGIATQSETLKRKRADQAHLPPAIVGSLKQKSQDPFQCLSSVEVGLIIEFLPVESTHTLRLVSKLWKASSEYHNATLAIRRHFPNSALVKKTYATREEANLQFRRLLYHQQSLKKGLATRATRCRSADFWHLNGNTLLWASKSGKVSVRDLRSVQNFPNAQGKALTLKPLAHLKHHAELCGASLTDDGDLLVQAYTWLNSESLSQARANSYDGVKVMRLSLEGNVLWDIYHIKRDILWKLAVGTRYLYYIHGSPLLGKQYLCRRSLEDGSVVFQKEIPFRHGYPAYQLELFGKEKWVAVSNGSTWVWLFDTTSGEVVATFSRRGWPVFSRTEGKYWEVEYTSVESIKPCSKSTCDANEKIWTRKNLSLQLDVTETLSTSSIAFDPDLQLCFRIRCDDSSHMLRLSVAPLTAQEPLQDDGTWVPGLAQSSGFVTVSLPTELPRQGLTRRSLKFQLPATKFGETGFSCMTGDYLILPDGRERTILVLDFWPDW